MVKVAGGYLTPILSRIGLKQGGILSSLLFNIYIDDIKQIFDPSCDPVNFLNNPLSHLLYADDMIMMSISQTGLNNCLKKLETYCDTWHLEVNITKTEIVIFNSSGKILQGYNFEYKGQYLKIVNSYCYLGVDISTSNSLTLARTNLVEKAKKACFPLQSAISQFNIPCKNAINLYHSYIKPIATYNSEILAQLSKHQIKSIESGRSNLITYLTQSITDKVHNKFLKFLLGVKRNCSNMATLGEVGELPLLYHGLVQMLSYWHRTSLMNDETLVKQALNFVMENGTEESEWLLSVKFILNLIQMNDIYNNPSSMSGKAFKENCSGKLKELLIEQWKYSINVDTSTNGQRNKLRIYKQFKQSFRFEEYLTYIKDFHSRRVVTRFRCSDHTLEIERGRHKKVKLEKRLCKMCKSNIESEMHFLQECPCYTTLRYKFFGTMQHNFYIDIQSGREKVSRKKYPVKLLLF